MQDTLYVDVLFFVNFAMDFVSLCITAKILRLHTARLRYILSAVLGGVFGVVSVILSPGALISFFAGVAVSFIMVLIITKGNSGFLKNVKYTAVLWGVGALLAGIVTFVCSLGGSITGGGVVFSKGRASFFVLSVAATAVFLLAKSFLSVPKVEECSVTVSLEGESVTLFALVDSGNLVVEPMSGLPVIFACQRKLSLLIGRAECEKLARGDILSLAPETAKRIRPVALSGVEKLSLVYGIIPDSVDIRLGKKVKSSRAIIVPESKKNYAGREAVMPQSLLI